MHILSHIYTESSERKRDNPSHAIGHNTDENYIDGVLDKGKHLKRVKYSSRREQSPFDFDEDIYDIEKFNDESAYYP
jgi:hypothetical protein